jgi:hypothetical protein
MTQPDPVTDDNWPYPIPPSGPQLMGQPRPTGDDMPTPLPPPKPLRWCAYAWVGAVASSFVVQLPVSPVLTAVGALIGAAMVWHPKSAVRLAQRGGLRTAVHSGGALRGAFAGLPSGSVPPT